MGPYDIYNATVTWKDCPDMRPWIIVGGQVGELWDCFPISTPHYSETYVFRLDAEAPEFPATGLNHTCHIHYGRIIQVPASCFKKKRGALVGDLLVEFKDVAGV